MNALIVGVIAGVCTILSFFGVPFTGFIGLVMGIVAWVMGNNAYKANPSDDKAKYGKFIGIAVTVLAIVSIVVSIVVVGSIVGAAAISS